MHHVTLPGCEYIQLQKTKKKGKEKKKRKKESVNWLDEVSLKSNDSLDDLLFRILGRPGRGERKKKKKKKPLLLIIISLNIEYKYKDRKLWICSS